MRSFSKIIFLFFFGACLLFGLNSSQAQSTDAIAIRVIPNPENYGAALWYQKQEFTGSPQALTVDGFEAVRDGRSVYVHAANIQGGNLYTNIYLISFNQDAENETIDIFGEILSHWKFSSNFPNSDFCNESTTQSCLYNDECPQGEYCNSDKAKIIRDTRRLASLKKIEFLLEDYKATHGYYPIINAGSYLPYVTISTWPSWQKLLAQYLGGVLPVDPINRLGDCGDPRFDPETCWDKESKEFADLSFTVPVNEVSLPTINLPAGSRAFIYVVSPNGLNYNLYSAMEDDYLTSGSSGSSTGGTTTNRAPVFTGSNLSGYSGEAFNGYLEFMDPDGNSPINVTINTGGTTWTSWSSPPIREYLYGIENQVKIGALSAGAAGSYTFTATLDDGYGGVTGPQTFTINIQNPKPIVETSYVNYVVSDTDPLDFNLTISDSMSSYPLAASLNPNPTTFGLNPFTFNLIPPALTAYRFNLSGFFNPGTEAPINPKKTYSFVLDITDTFSAVTSRMIVVNVSNDQPRPQKITDNRGSGTVVYDRGIGLTSPVSFEVSIGESLPLRIEYLDPNENYPLSFSIVGGPTGFNSSGGIDIDGRSYNLDGTIIDSTISYPVTIDVMDQYGGVSPSHSFNVIVKNNPPGITSAPVTTAIGCMPYNYDVNALDPDGHSLTYVGHHLLPGLTIDPGSGIVSGRPILYQGAYAMTVGARDQYYSLTSPKSDAEGTQTFNVNVTNAVFSVNAPADGTIYVFANSGTGIYNSPTQYNGTASASSPYPVTYSLSDPFHPIPAGFLSITPDFYLYIDAATGAIQGTPTNNDDDPGTYVITVHAMNECGVDYTDTFELTVLPNGWCGNGTVDSGSGEECEEAGDGTAIDNQYDCVNCQWTGGWCGDSLCGPLNTMYVQDNIEECGDTNILPICNTDCSLCYCRFDDAEHSFFDTCPFGL